MKYLKHFPFILSGVFLLAYLAPAQAQSAAEQFLAKVGRKAYSCAANCSQEYYHSSSPNICMASPKYDPGSVASCEERANSAYRMCILHCNPMNVAYYGIVVPSTAMPWVKQANPKTAFDPTGGTPPVRATELSLRAGERLYIETAGKIQSAATSAETVATNYPARYANAEGLTPRPHMLVGAFVDSKGALVAKPFVVDGSIELAVPEGADSLQFGINDTDYSHNEGALAVVVQRVPG